MRRLKLFTGLLAIALILAYAFYCLILILESGNDPVTNNFAGAALQWLALILAVVVIVMYKNLHTNKHEDKTDQWEEVKELAKKNSKKRS